MKSPLEELLVSQDSTPIHYVFLDPQDGRGVRRGDHLPPHKYIYTWNCSYRTPTEHWQKTSDHPKGKKLPTHLSRAKEKTETKE